MECFFSTKDKAESINRYRRGGNSSGFFSFLPLARGSKRAFLLLLLRLYPSFSPCNVKT